MYKGCSEQFNKIYPRKGSIMCDACHLVSLPKCWHFSNEDFKATSSFGFLWLCLKVKPIGQCNKDEKQGSSLVARLEKIHVMPNMSGVVARLRREFRRASGVISLAPNSAHHGRRILGAQHRPPKNLNTVTSPKINKGKPPAQNIFTIHDSSSSQPPKDISNPSVTLIAW